MDLVRKILFAVEASESGVLETIPEIDNFSENEINYHIQIMHQSNLLTAIPTDYGHSISNSFMNIQLTWDGHEFIDAARNDKIWKNAKEVVQEKVGSIGVGVLIQLLSSMAKSQLGIQ